QKSIAVLPLKPINTANRDEIYEIGIADSLILKLSSMKGFIVRPLSATRKYADIEQDPLAAGQEQKVDYVLASNYQLAGGKIRVTSQLFNVASGQIEETYKSEKDAADIFAMQDAIAGEVGNILLARFVTTAGSPTAKRGTTNEEAYRLYLQGMYLVDKRNLAEARKAVENFDQAVRLDPNYAQAWAGKAHAHRAIGNFGRSPNIQEEYQKSIEAINKALALDENLADAHSALCENKMLYEWDFDGAERECKRAIELDPNSSLAHQIYSRYLYGRGRFDEAIAEIKTAIDLDPASLYSQRLYGNSLYFARRYTEAVLQFKRVIVMDPNFGSTYQWLVTALEMKGNYDEAFEWFMKAQALQKADEETVQIFKKAYQTSGWEGVLREQVRRFEDSDAAYFYGASINAKVGNKDKAFEYLEKSYQRRELWMSMLKVDPRLDSLRGDPRFDELVKRVELK
ncbi:MAG: tetratricopeptide repeat protein, partial [Acidobacteria bacterium]|nr:tetratricopeptide repeat protein [Acidobacteriota bacterium]